MSLPNMPYGVKCTLKLRNAYEIHGLDSVHSSDFCLGPVHACFCIMGHSGFDLSMVSDSCKALSRAKSRGWERVQK